MGGKYNSNVFTFSCDILVVLVCLNWVEPKSVLTGDLHLLATVTDRIRHTNFNFKYYIWCSGRDRFR